MIQGKIHKNKTVSRRLEISLKKALQEWGLLSDTQRSTYAIATTEMQNRLDPGSKMIAVQEFRHMAQKAIEQVNDFIRRLEQSF